MNITVAVALITSISTLTGALIASITGFKISSNQSITLRTQRQREIRRDAYVQLLSKFDEMASLLIECWTLYPESENTIETPKHIEKAYRLLNDIEIALNVVRIEGPQDVIDGAEAVSVRLNHEYELMLDISATYIGVEGERRVLGDIAKGEYGVIDQSYEVSKAKLIAAIKHTLG